MHNDVWRDRITVVKTQEIAAVICFENTAIQFPESFRLGSNRQASRG